MVRQRWSGLTSSRLEIVRFHVQRRGGKPLHLHRTGSGAVFLSGVALGSVALSFTNSRLN